MSEVYIVIPARNESNRIGKVISQTSMLGYQNIVVVDDGSTDNTKDVALDFGATVLSHSINLGAGAATQTGIEFALKQGAEIIVTIDGDQQHFPKDIELLIATLQQEAVDVVIGSRFLLKGNEIPVLRRVYNKIGNWLTKLITGISVSDSQSGLKAFSANFAQKIDFDFNGYEFCTEFIYIIRQQKASFVEVPIHVYYDEYTLDKGQSLGNGIKMAFRFFKHFI